MEEIELVRAQLKAHEENRPYALVTIARTDGSTTRTQGKMLVCEEGPVLGSVGGGAVETLAVRDARAALKSGRGGLRDYDLNTGAARTGAACGGAMTVLIEVFGVRPTLIMSGAGHVGAAVLALAGTVGFHTVLVDSRPRESIENVVALADEFVHVTDFETGLRELDIAPGGYYVLAGPNHDCDGAALAGALTKAGAYVGMIGGPPKIAAIFQRLRERGVEQSALDGVYTPIGLDIGGERPEEIAISILAQVLMVRNGKTVPRP